MSRSDWFTCLKQAFDQLLASYDDQENGVEKEVFTKMIEINYSIFPLVPLHHYLGSTQSHLTASD
jgi:hypothetical protein